MLRLVFLSAPLPETIQWDSPCFWIPQVLVETKSKKWEVLSYLSIELWLIVLKFDMSAFNFGHGYEQHGHIQAINILTLFLFVWIYKQSAIIFKKQISSKNAFLHSNVTYNTSSTLSFDLGSSIKAVWVLSWFEQNTDIWWRQYKTMYPLLSIIFKKTNC